MMGLIVYKLSTVFCALYRDCYKSLAIGHLRDALVDICGGGKVLFLLGLARPLHDGLDARLPREALFFFLLPLQLALFVRFAQVSRHLLLVDQLGFLKLALKQKLYSKI